MKNITRTQYQAFPFHLVEPSPWPILTSFALLTLTVSAVLYFHGFVSGGELLTLGFILVSGGMVLWFRDVITEGTKKKLFSLHIASVFTKVILTIALFYAIAFVIYVVYIQSIGSDMGIFSGLFLSSLLPVKPKQLSNLERQQFTLSEELKQILVGLILGDLYIFKQRVNPSLTFRQGIKHEEYLRYLYDRFKDFCPSGPKIQNSLPDKRTGKVYNAIWFITYTLPCFIPLYEVFYVAGKKVVPANIAELLTLVGLCYWICDDGFWDSTSRRVVLCTESFSPAEIQSLIDVLNSKWNLKCYKSKRENSYRIMIPSYSVPHLQGLLKDIMPPMMLFKLGL